MKLIITIFVHFAILSNCFSQDDWIKTWDKNYPEAKLVDICNNEKKYADKIEAQIIESQYYSRIDKYRIKGKYLGKTKPIEKSILSSMKRVYKLFVGKSDVLEKDVKHQMQFEVEGFNIWIPVQEVLIKSFEEELEIGTEVTLYCLFLKEHTNEKELYNHFLISEFHQ